MYEFVTQSLSPGIFWVALASIGTLLAVLVALFQPSVTRYFLNNRIELLLKAELDGNVELIRGITSEEIILSRGNEPPVTVSAATVNDALIEQIELPIWHQYRYEIAASRPESFENYQAVNRSAEALINVPREPTSLKVELQNIEAVAFVKSYEERFK